MAASPSMSPSASPSPSPSASPSKSPSASPSKSPSASPSASPSPVAAGEVGYTLHDRQTIGKKHITHVAITFGGTYDYYPDGGIPLTTLQLGMIRSVDSVVILESNGDALMYEWDRSANAIRIFYPTQETGSSANRAGIEFTKNVTNLSATTLELEVIGW